jgi:hypothetical protein
MIENLFATLMHKRQKHMKITLSFGLTIFSKLLLARYISRQNVISSVVASMNPLLVAALVCHFSACPNA